MLIIDKNSIINIILLLGCIILGYFYSYWILLIYPIILFLDDFFYYSKGMSLFDPEIRVQRGYEFPHLFYDDISEKGLDYEFNLYDGDLTKSNIQAQQDKWDFLIQKLSLKEGDFLIDIGCGYGDWINYAKSKGIHVVGINLSPQQTKVCKEKGLDVICINWKDISSNVDLKNKLYRKFDAVTFMGSVEHFVPSRLRKNEKMINQIYRNMFHLASDLLKDKSTSNRIFISCLHQITKIFTIKDLFYCYLIDHFHSGYYPVDDDGLTKTMPSNFIEIERFDKTEDYRLTSVLNKHHFGFPTINWTFKRIMLIPILFILDPHHLHKWLYIKTSVWMKWHFGKNAWDKTYYRSRETNARLWWLLIGKKS